MIRPLAAAFTEASWGMIQDVKFLCLVALVQAVALGAMHRATAAEVVELVFTSLSSDHDDARLARGLHGIEMSEQLSPHVVVYFEGLGVGPESLAMLRTLRDRSATLEPPVEAPLAIQPLPSQDEQAAMIRSVVHYAQSYVERLPNFMCDQVTERYTNFDGIGVHDGPLFGKKLHRSDRIIWRLRLIDGVEDGNVLQRGREVVRKMSWKTGGSFSRGEFGEDLGHDLRSCYRLPNGLASLGDVQG